MARSIFESIAPHFSEDFHFWLQYGSLELEYGELDFAENYIKQAKSLAPNDDFVETTSGFLYYKQAIYGHEKQTCLLLRDQARTILLLQMDRRPSDMYPAHIFCAQELNWIKHWPRKFAEKKALLEQLRDNLTVFNTKYGFPDRLKTLKREVDDYYLDMAKSPSQASPWSLPGRQTPAHPSRGVSSPL